MKIQTKNSKIESASSSKYDFVYFTDIGGELFDQVKMYSEELSKLSKTFKVAKAINHNLSVGYDISNRCVEILALLEPVKVVTRGRSSDRVTLKLEGVLENYLYILEGLNKLFDKKVRNSLEANESTMDDLLTMSSKYIGFMIVDHLDASKLLERRHGQLEKQVNALAQIKKTNKTSFSGKSI